MKKQFFKLILLTTIIGLGCKKNPTTTPSATITALNCTAATFSSVLTNGVQTTGVNATIPYTGGNGGTYSAISVSSTGVTGLTATTVAGNVANGNGNLVLTLNGTPTNSGTASFLINLGGQSCTANVTVNATVGTATVTSISCGSATMTGTLKSGTIATNIPLVIPYVGGNGGTYSALSIPSTGVLGLTASASAGSVTNGNGNLTLVINGTPSSAGTATFSITIGGKTCSFSTTVNGTLNKSLIYGWWKVDSKRTIGNEWDRRYFGTNDTFRVDKGMFGIETGKWNWVNNSDTIFASDGTGSGYAVVKSIKIDSLNIVWYSWGTNAFFYK